MISLSNLLKQRYVINLESEKIIINGDDRFATGNHAASSGGDFSQGEVIPGSEELLDGFLAGLEAEEITLEPQITPEELLAQAQEEADNIIAVANAEAARIANEASKQAEILYEQKRQEGYALGAQQLQEEFDAKTAELEAEFDAKGVSLQEEYEAKMETLESDIIDVMIRVFHKVFNVQFDNKKQILLHLIKDTLLGIDAGKNFTIRVAETNFKFIESHVADIKEKIGNDVTIDVVNDMTLEEDDCIIETATGVYNCGIDMVLTNLEKDIKSLCR